MSVSGRSDEIPDTVVERVRAADTEHVVARHERDRLRDPSRCRGRSSSAQQVPAVEHVVRVCRPYRRGRPVLPAVGEARVLEIVDPGRLDLLSGRAAPHPQRTVPEKHLKPDVALARELDQAALLREVRERVRRPGSAPGQQRPLCERLEVLALGESLPPEIRIHPAPQPWGNLAPGEGGLDGDRPRHASTWPR